MKKSSLFILGTIVGLGVATTTLFTTKKGREMKKLLIKKVDGIQDKLVDIEMSEVKQAIVTKLEEVTHAIHHFDWEASKEEIEKKYFEIKDKIKVIKDHLDVAKVKVEKTTGEEEDFTLVIDQAKGATEK